MSMSEEEQVVARAGQSDEFEKTREGKSRLDRISAGSAFGSMMISLFAFAISLLAFCDGRQAAKDAKETTLKANKDVAAALATMKAMAEANKRSAAAAEMSAGVAQSALDAAAESNRIATDSLRIASRQLESTDRASVKARFEVSGPLQFMPDGGASARFRYTLTNTGRSPATNISVRATIHAGPFDNSYMPSVIAKQKETCDAEKRHLRRKGPGADFWGDTLGANETIQENMVIGIGREQIAAARIQTPVGVPEGIYFSPALVGCVGYRIRNGASPWVTPFAYMIKRRAVGEGLPRLLRAGDTVPLEDIVFERYPFGGQNME